MSVRVQTRFAIIPEWLLFSGVSAQAIRLYAVLMRKAEYGSKDSDVKPAEGVPRKWLADKMDVTVKTVDRAMKELVDLGAVQVIPNKNGKERAPNDYLLVMSLPSPTDVATPTPEDVSTGSPTDVAVRTENLEPREQEHEITPALSQLLADLIEENGSRRPVVTSSWKKAERLLLTRDGRDYDEAEHLIRWSQASEFWAPNILSMPKFREKYDTLRLQAKRGNGSMPLADRLMASALADFQEGGGDDRSRSEGVGSTAFGSLPGA